MAVTDGRRDSGINLSGIKKFMKTQGFRIAATVLIAAFVVGFMGMMYVTIRNQERKLDELIGQKRQLEDRLDELAREKERLEGKLEYTNSLEGLLQYARDNLGYVFPDDTRIDDGQGN